MNHNEKVQIKFIGELNYKCNQRCYFKSCHQSTLLVIDFLREYTHTTCVTLFVQTSTVTVK